MPGAQIALAGSVILLGGLIVFVFLSLLSTSLIITTAVDKKGDKLTACGMIGWGIFGAQFRWDQGCGTLRVRILNHALWSKSLQREDLIPAVARKPARKREIAWRSLLPEVLEALRFLARHLRVRAVSADMVLGFPSAQATGTIFGYVQAVKGILAPVSCVSLQMTPDFDRTVCDGRLSGTFEVRYPLILGFRFVQLGVRRPVRDIWFNRRIPS